MATFSPGFGGRRRAARDDLPPGQYETHDFPVLSYGPTPHVPRDTWQFTLTDENGARRSWSWQELLDLPQEDITVDIHCVTKWSKFATSWRGVSLDVLLDDVETSADFAVAHSYGGYTTNLPLDDLLDGKAWIAHGYDGQDLEPEHGGPARLLVPHLYFWKSAKWVDGLRLTTTDEPGFWETNGYHAYGDPWREQRYWGD
ncbi:sulfite oxidase-like oxidoreductase [Kineococcus rhizosphaerae]|uniref:DMSO/TMAO reductase YedYZ molybdopterin-dependent catalytic subunit n=1 Tax=Kineococcus rhizosphaerae TaxID=559628 RepID=A0A2T0R689_9ACTN|nr:sulfite oxidase-like oxidoreductase [Kineococcus rhizosphaerae]PRY16662.1 DMSO/TMAO reductase YedYZ molybdopterin-dependent catalytic subunit [Kineococcus rhizosphaerae]